MRRGKATLAAGAAWSVLLAAMAGGAALAQDATVTPQQTTAETEGQQAAAGGGPSESGERLDELVVTAQRREERLQDVPIQVTALSAQTVQDAGIKSTEQALNMVANVQFDRGDTYHGTFITMRGLTEINNADPPVAMVVDGVPLTNQKQLNMSLFDIERIEVLKGPQGALYGRNAVGGAVNIVTKAPTNDFHGFGDVSYANGDQLIASAGVSGPLVKDKILFRLSADYRHDNGRIENTFLDDNVDFVDHDYSLRGRVLITPVDRLTIDLRAEYNNFKAGSNYYSAVFSGSPNDFVDPQFDVPGFTYGHNVDLTGKVDYRFDFATLTSITGYSHVEEIDRADLDFRNSTDSPGGFFGTGLQLGQGQDQFIDLTSQEVRLVSNSEGRFRWLFGGYYLHTDRDLLTRGFIDLQNMTTGQPGSTDQINNPALLIIAQSESNSNDAWAGFGQADFDITSQLTLTGGLRYDRDRRDQVNTANGSERVRSFDALQPKVTLTYKFDPDRLVYATYGTGFRSGGFNAPLVSTPVFAPERLRNYEAGFKTAWFGHRLFLNGAAFLSKVRNYQFFYVDALSASQIISNLERVEIKGLELEGQALLAPGLTANAAIGVTDSSIERSTIYPGAEGNKTPRTVPFSASSSLQYRHALTQDFTGMARVDWMYYGKKYWGVDNADVQHPYSIVNLRAGVEKGGIGLYGFVRNLTDSGYYSEYVPSAYSGLDIDIGFRGQPRTYGVELRASF